MIGRKRAAGLTLVEVLVTVVLLAIVLVPAISALRTGIVGADVHADVSTSHYRLTSRLEEMMAYPFADLSAAALAAGSATVPTSYSEPSGPGRLVVFLSLYDGDNADADNDPFTGTEPDLLWIRVDIEGSVHTLETVRARGF